MERKLMDYLSRSMTDLMNQVASQQEAIMVEQLNELISRGLLVVEKTEPLFVTNNGYESNDGYKIEYRQKIRLLLKDQEYIEKLEKENKELKEQFQKLDNNICNLMETIDRLKRGYNE